MEQNIRTFKDFLEFYNLMTQTCFTQCINTFKRPEVEGDERDCVEKCAHKLIRFNNRTIGIFADVQMNMNQRRLAEAQELEAKNQQVEELKDQQQSEGSVEQ